MTKIEWTQATWNPIVGCSKVSEGCRNCYAEKMAKRLVAMGQEKYAGTIDERGLWTGQINLDEKALLEPLKRKKPTVYFVNSMSDLFHENVPDEWIYRIFSVMYAAKRHTFQVLTKRPERMMAWIQTQGLQQNNIELPLPNVWLGVSVENQKAADERIPLLLQTPAAVRFLSCEPLLGPVDLTYLKLPSEYNISPSVPGRMNALTKDDEDRYYSAPNTIDWVIAGGESGPGARPMHPDWVCSLRNQCQAAGVPFFFKQWGEWAADYRMFESKEHWIAKGQNWLCERTRYNGRTASWGYKSLGLSCLSLDGKILQMGKDFDECQYPVAIVGKVGKKKAGRELDGRTWDEMPK